MAPIRPWRLPLSARGGQCGLQHGPQSELHHGYACGSDHRGTVHLGRVGGTVGFDESVRVKVYSKEVK